MSDFTLLDTRDPHFAQAEALNFWTQDLRMPKSVVQNAMALLHDSEARLEAVGQVLQDKRSLRTACKNLDVGDEGTIAELQVRVCGERRRAVAYVLIARFAHRKLQAAIDDVAEGNLDADTLASLRLDNGQLHRLSTLITLYEQFASTLLEVRVLDAWHRKGAASLVIADKVLLPRKPIADFLNPMRVAPILAADFPGVRAEVHLRRGGEYLLFLRRNLRPTWHWDLDGNRVQHGFEEELIALHFLQGGRIVRVSATDGDLPRKVAERLASEFFAQPVHYQEDHQATAEASIQAFITALLDPEDTRLTVVEAVFDNGPLPNSPRVIVTDFTTGDIAPALHFLETHVGAVFENLDDVRKLKVSWEGHRIALCFPLVAGLRVVHFWDSRIDNNRAASFARFMREEFGLEIRSVETRRR